MSAVLAQVRVRLRCGVVEAEVQPDDDPGSYAYPEAVR
jgi:hypothetical protein